MVKDDDGDEAIGTVWKGNARGCFVRGDWSVALRRLFWSTYWALSACRFLPSPSHPTKHHHHHLDEHNELLLADQVRASIPHAT